MSQSSHESNTPPGSRRRTTIVIGICLAFASLLTLVGTFYKNNRPFSISVPTPRMPVPNAYDDFVRAGNLAKAMQHKSPFSNATTTYSYAEFKAAAMDAQPAVVALQQGLGKQYMNPPVRSLKASYNLTPFAGFRELERTLSAVSVYQEMDGKTADAVETRLDGIQMGVMIARGGNILADLVSIACESIAANRIEPLLPNLSAPELAHVADRLRVIASMQTPFADVVQEEGYQNAVVQEGLFKNSKAYGGFAGARSLVGGSDVTSQGLTVKSTGLSTSWKALCFVLADKQAMIHENQEYYKALTVEVRGPFKLQSIVRAPVNPIAQMLQIEIVPCRAKVVSTETMLNILRVEVALLQYKKSNGRYPMALADLVTTYLPAATIIDEFTSTPLKYRALRNETAYLLYSVGPDLVDNMGIPSRYVGSSPGDIVANQMWPYRTFTKSVTKPATRSPVKN